MSLTITKTTRFAGRKYRGRAFFAGLPVTSESDSLLAPAVLANWEVISDLFNDIITNGDVVWQPILWHRATNTYDDILTAHVKLVLRNQRRRQVGVGQ
jgi:hypothetical protein